jgi:hypothetical protein
MEKKHWQFKGLLKVQGSRLLLAFVRAVPTSAPAAFPSAQMELLRENLSASRVASRFAVQPQVSEIDYQPKHSTQSKRERERERDKKPPRMRVPTVYPVAGSL